MSTTADRVFVPEQLDFATRSPPPAGDPSGAASWSFSYRPAVSGTLRYPDGSTGGTRVELTDEESALLRQLLVTVAKRVQG
jgi:hypothetical protein